MAQQNVMQNPYGAPRAWWATPRRNSSQDPRRVRPHRARALRGVQHRAVAAARDAAVALVPLLGDFGVVLVAVAYIAMFVLQIMLTIQRSHDFNMSGWFSLLMFVPLVGLLFWFVPGTDGGSTSAGKTPPNSGLRPPGGVDRAGDLRDRHRRRRVDPGYQDYVKRAQTQQSRWPPPASRAELRLTGKSGSDPDFRRHFGSASRRACGAPGSAPGPSRARGRRASR